MPRPDELDMIAESGATIVTNFSSNLHLHSGLAPIADAHRRGCPIAVGVDGVALDEDDDAIREMRLVQMAHDGLGFDRTWGRAEFLALAIRNGRKSIRAPGSGMLAPGAPADFIVLDIGRLDGDAIMPLDPLDMLFARGNASHVAEVVVAGRTVARAGVPTGIDLQALEAELRAACRGAIEAQASSRCLPGNRSKARSPMSVVESSDKYPASINRNSVTPDTSLDAEARGNPAIRREVAYTYARKLWCRSCHRPASPIGTPLALVGGAGGVVHLREGAWGGGRGWFVSIAATARGKEHHER